jgi:hypothetical protein
MAMTAPQEIRGGAGVVIVLLALAAAACRPPTAVERMLGPRAHTAAPSNDGSCHFDLSGERADTVFFTLGLLSESGGRTIVEDDDQVEKFYCDETDAARLFRRTLGTLAQEQGVNPDIREQTGQQCVIVYHSKPIADRVNSCFRYQMTDGEMARGSDGFYLRMASPSLGDHLFVHGSGSFTEQGLDDRAFFRRRALAYLGGAWARYGHGADFVFHGAVSKANLTAELLTDLGCHDVRVESTVGVVPGAITVHFQPTSEVTQWLRKLW